MTGHSTARAVTRAVYFDRADFWEFPATGFRGIDDSNRAYKLGVNYSVFGWTH